MPACGPGSMPTASPDRASATARIFSSPGSPIWSAIRRCSTRSPSCSVPTCWSCARLSSSRRRATRAASPGIRTAGIGISRAPAPSRPGSRSPTAPLPAAPCRCCRAATETARDRMRCAPTRDGRLLRGQRIADAGGCCDPHDRVARRTVLAARRVAGARLRAQPERRAAHRSGGALHRHERPQRGPRQLAMLVRGVDRHGLHPLAQAPRSDDDASGTRRSPTGAAPLLAAGRVASSAPTDDRAPAPDRTPRAAARSAARGARPPCLKPTRGVGRREP